MPKIHVALVGHRESRAEIGRPRAVSADARDRRHRAGISPATTRCTAARGRTGEIDGPEEFHVVLLDNHRTRLLADAEQRDALHCIRCGACLNVCPIFQNIGGHAYGTTYQGPIGCGHHAALARLAGLEASERRLVAVRRLHRGVPGENRYASSPAAKSPQRRAREKGVVGAGDLVRLRRADETPVGLPARRAIRAARANISSVSAKQRSRSAATRGRTRASFRRLPHSPLATGGSERKATKK